MGGGGVPTFVHEPHQPSLHTRCLSAGDIILDCAEGGGADQQALGAARGHVRAPDAQARDTAGALCSPLMPLERVTSIHWHSMIAEIFKVVKKYFFMVFICHCLCRLFFDNETSQARYLFVQNHPGKKEVNVVG